MRAAIRGANAQGRGMGGKAAFTNSQYQRSHVRTVRTPIFEHGVDIRIGVFCRGQAIAQVWFFDDKIIVTMYHLTIKSNFRSCNAMICN